MVVLRVFWALFLAGLVAYTFHRSWSWEHGEPMPEALFGGDKPRTKETVVWVDPSFLPVLLLLFLILFGAMAGRNGVERFFALLLDVMLVISVYFLLLMFLLPVFRRYFSARACATMWILPVFMFWQAHILFRNAPVPSIVIYIPASVLKMLFLVWGIGFVVVFGGRFLSHFHFRKKVMSACVPVRDLEVLELFEQELKKLEYYHPVRLVMSGAVAAPFSMGTTKRSRVTVLPDREFTRQELQFIFQHEIHHLQRGDVSNKIFFAFCQALCWFNPLIWVATRKASDDLELSCDEIVLEGMDEEMRRQYAQLLLNTAGHAGGFTTCLSAAAETMRYRLKNVVTVQKRYPGTLMLAIAMFLCVMSYGTIAVSNEKGTVAELITESRTAEDIRSVFYQPKGESSFREVFTWGREELFSYLTTLEVEKLSSANEIPNMGGQRVSMVVEHSGAMQMVFYDNFVEVHHYRRSGYPEYYYLRSEMDWDIVNGYLDLNAERPKVSQPRELPMRVHFDVDGQEITSVAVQEHFRAWDVETGETLWSFKDSTPAGGLSGLKPTRARLVFEMPILEIKAWMREGGDYVWTQAALAVKEEDYVLFLQDGWTHYQVDVVYQPENGVGYESSYVFDVE